jgi:tetratricopeptide (TPR) repeat protein
VRRAGNRVRITAQLIDAATGNHVWAERYDHEFADIFAVQDDITERVVGAVEPELYAAEHFRSQRKLPESLDAWECVMRALSYVGQGTQAGATEAEALCRRATAIAPHYAEAHSLLAWVLLRGTDWFGNVQTILPEATAAAQTALGFDERDPWAHLAHGMVFWRMRRHGEAERAYRRALEFNPNFALAHALIGIPLVAQGGHEEAIERAKHALRLSPSDGSVGYYASIAMLNAHFAAGRYAECVVWARSAIERNSGHPWGYVLLIASAAMQPDMQAAAEALAMMLRLRPDFSLTWVSAQTTWTGDMSERLLEGLRKAGVPEG